MRRDPPPAVKKALRREVGFGCPVPGCNSPYLEWHHFDPPWHVQEHHNPEGMIALCSHHHKKADHGAYTIQQLKDFKKKSSSLAAVSGEFDWRRSHTLIKFGSNFAYNIRSLLNINGKDIIWFTRDENENLLLNFSGIYFGMVENFWTLSSDALDIISPPSGKRLQAKHPSGEEIFIEFREIKQYEELLELGWTHSRKDIDLPITLVEFNYTSPGGRLKMSNKSTTLDQGILTGCLFKNGHTVIAVRSGSYLTVEKSGIWKNIFKLINY